MTWLTDWDMTVDHENHAILTWQDIRSGGNNNVVAYRISPKDFVLEAMALCFQIAAISMCRPK